MSFKKDISSETIDFIRRAKASWEELPQDGGVRIRQKTFTKDVVAERRLQGGTIEKVNLTKKGNEALLQATKATQQVQEGIKQGTQPFVDSFIELFKSCCGLGVR